MSKKLMSGMSLESIKFQSGVLFHELTALYAEARETGLSEPRLADADEVKAIAKCIKHHTGLNVVISVANGGPAVMIPHVHKNHPFIDEWMREYFDDGDVYHQMKKAGGTIKGSVDLANSRVSGIFSTIESTIIMPYAWIMGRNGATPEECAAVTLHEVGHLFTYYEYISRTTTTNQVLAALHRGYAEADTIDKRTTILVSAKKALQLKDEGVNELAKSTNAEVVVSVILSNMVEKSRSELGVNIYDMNSWEYLADEFAARHQAGKNLITGLDKIYKQFGHMSYRTKGTYIAMEALKLSLLIMGLMSTALIGLPSVIILMYGFILVSQDSDVVIYDEPEARMRRIKQQIIQAMKDGRVSKEEVTRMTEDLKTIDSIMEGVKDKRQWLGIIYDTISAKGRKNRGAVVLQQQLETLANNELFAKAAQFKNV